jgi:hypothetical protein
VAALVAAAAWGAPAELSAAEAGLDGGGAAGTAAATLPADGETDDSADLREQAQLELGPLTLAPIVLLALQVTPYVGDDSFFQAGDIAEREGFRLRRGRLGFAGDFMERARFAVSTELSSSEDGKVRIYDAWLGYTQFEWLRAYAGARTVPYSRSALARSGNAALIERPLAVRAMAPQHQIGAALDGELWEGKLGYTGGVYNGFQRSEYFYAGYEENYAPFGNRFHGLAYAGRLRAAPLGRLDPTIADERHSPFRFGVGASYFYSDGGAVNTHSAAGDALLHVAGFHLLAEALWSLADPDETPTVPTDAVEQVTAFAAVGEAGYMILEEMLGVTARFEWIDPNTNTDNEGDNWLLTAGASYQLLDRLLRVQAEYTHREEINGLSLANDSFTLQFQLQLSALAGAEYPVDGERPDPAGAGPGEAGAEGAAQPAGRAETEVRTDERPPRPKPDAARQPEPPSETEEEGEESEGEEEASEDAEEPEEEETR